MGESTTNIITNIQAFMKRSQLAGSEVPAYIEAWAWLETLKRKKESDDKTTTER